jgi:hypothetical protein
MGDPETPEIVTPVSGPIVTPFAATWPSRNWTPTEKVTAGMMNSLRDQLNELHTTSATLVSPVFTGNPTAPTPTAGDNDTSIATTAFVQTEYTTHLNSLILIDGATIALDASSRRNYYRIIAGGNRTLLAPTNPTDGQKIIIQHFANAAAYTLTLTGGAGGFRLGTDITAITQTAANKMDYIGAIYCSQTNTWDVVAYTKGF